MATRDFVLSNGGDDMGMSDSQYKGMLLDQLQDWEDVLELLKSGDLAKLQQRVEQQIEKTNQKLKV